VITPSDHPWPMIDWWGNSCGALRTGPVALALVSTLLVLAGPGPAAAASASGLVNRVTSATTGAGQEKPRVERAGHRGYRQIRRGIVQAVFTRAVVLKQLDGTTLTVPVDARTRVLVDGRRSMLTDVKPGFVAVAVLKPGGPAQELRTFSLPPRSGRSAPSSGPSSPHSR
jgi:hypothetical protein